MWLDWFRPGRSEAQLLIGHGYWAVHQAATGWQSETCTNWREGLLQARQALDKGIEVGMDVRVWLSGAMCPALWLVPPEGLRDEEKEAWVVASVQAQHPLRSELVEPVVWLDSTQAGGGLAAAIPSAWLAQILAVFDLCRPARVAPVWSLAFVGLDFGEAPGLSLASAFDGESMTSVEFDGTRVIAASSLVGLTDAGQAQSHHLRCSARGDFAATRLLQLQPRDLPLCRQSLPQAWSEVGS